MATYPSIFSKAEDAIAYAFDSIPDAADDISGFTVYKGGSPSEKALPAVTFVALEFAKITPESDPQFSQTFNVTLSAVVETSMDDETRAEAYEAEGLVEAVLFRSADQIVDECNAAGVSDFTALQWIPLSASRDFDGTRRTTTFIGSLICGSSALT